MAATAAFGSLSVPAPDDTMEMSSPANRTLDDDIDIDFGDGDFSGGVNLTEDERMLEDGETRPATATDDMMEDDLLSGEQSQMIEKATMQDQIDEEIMKYDIPQDEELIDYGEDEFQDQIVDDAGPSPPSKPVRGDEIGFVQLGDEISTVVESALTEIPSVTLQEELSSPAAQAEAPPAQAEASLATEAHVEDVTGLGDDIGPKHEHEVPQVEEAYADPPTYEAEREEDSSTLPPPINTALSASTTDTPGTPTDTGLHPMNIRYGDMMFPLFKSKRQPDGLLKGDNLAHLSLADLIKDCRQRLALKIGEDVSKDQELVLGFEHMGLMLVEDCRAAFQSSLHDVLQVYLQLHENDGADDVPPLSLSLTMQLKFQSSFAILKEAAAGGQGMSTFNFLQTATGDQDYQEEFEGPGDLGPHEEYQYEEGQEAHEYGGARYYEGGEQDQISFFEDHYDTNGEHDGQSYDDNYEHDEDAEHGEQQSYIQEEDEAAVRLDELEEGHRYEQGLLATAFEDPGVAADEVTVAKQQDESAAAFTTAHGDSADYEAGEYDEDLIDWDDDSLTTTLSEHDAEAHEDMSTFLTEYEDDEAKDGLPLDGAEDGQSQAPVNQSAPPGQAADNIGSEDFLNEPAGQEYGDADRDGEETFEGEHGAGEHGEEYIFDQADTYDEQYDENHPDYQPAEDDEQYHTAHDFLNTEQYEHGLEHDPYGEEGDGLDDTLGTVIHHETTGYQEEYLEHDDLEDLGDEIGFDDEDEGGLENGGSVTISGSPTGKRSFDELEDEFDDEDDREVKKARAS